MQKIVEWRGESGQDCFAFRMCREISNGTFLDIGCNEPIRWNNTYALEQIGWRGVGVDTEFSYAKDWAKFRSSQFIHGDACYMDWPTILELKNIGPKVDYLSLDIDEDETRGITQKILKGLFEDGLEFRVMTVEHDAYRFGNEHRDKLREFIKAKGYSLAHGDIEIGQFRGGDCNRKGNGKPFEDWWVR